MSYCWTYIKSEPGLWTVGFCGPDGWEPEGDHKTTTSAALRCHFLNGGNSREVLEDIQWFLRLVDETSGVVDREGKLTPWNNLEKLDEIRNDVAALIGCV